MAKHRLEDTYGANDTYAEQLAEMNNELATTQEIPMATEFPTITGVIENA